jgi:hypothetical protein
MTGFIFLILASRAASLDMGAIMNMSATVTATGAIFLPPVSSRPLIRLVTPIGYHFRSPAHNHSVIARAQVFGVTAVLSWEIQSSSSVPTSYDFAVYNDLHFTGVPHWFNRNRHSHFYYLHNYSHGFTVSASSADLSFRCRSHPLVVDASTFWFGKYEDWIDHFYENVSQIDAFVDPAMAISWQNRSLPAHGRDVLSIVVHWQFAQSCPFFSVDRVTPVVHRLDTISVRGTVTTQAEMRVHVLAVLDGDYRYITEVAQIGQGVFNGGIPVSSLNVEPGDHELTFYAVSDSGSFAQESFRFPITIVDSPVESPVKTDQALAEGLPPCNRRAREESMHVALRVCKKAIEEMGKIGTQNVESYDGTGDSKRPLSPWLENCKPLFAEIYKYDQLVRDRHNRICEEEVKKTIVAGIKRWFKTRREIQEDGL